MDDFITTITHITAFTVFSASHTTVVVCSNKKYYSRHVLLIVYYLVLNPA